MFTTYLQECVKDLKYLKELAIYNYKSNINIDNINSNFEGARVLFYPTGREFRVFERPDKDAA
ncbi:MAG: hypothetical protein ACTSPN_10940 [Promethearchaeota archaeon]